MTDKTGKKQKPEHLFKPGQSGNPLGRPKGSRNRLSEDFISALSDDFAEHGKAVIEAVRAESPVDYIKVVASLAPKQVTIQDDTLERMSDIEIVNALAAIDALANIGSEAKARARSGEERSAEETNGARRPH